MRGALVAAAFADCALAHNPHDVVSSLWSSPDGEHVLAISRGLMLRSKDGGLNWARSHNGLPPFEGETPKYMEATGFGGAANQRTIFLLDAAEDGMALHRSDNNGASWWTVVSPTLKEAAYIDAEYTNVPAGTRLALAAGSEHGSGKTTMVVAAKNLLRSVDSGKTFTAVHSEGLFDVTSVITASNGSMFASTLKGNVFSTDAGITWTPAGELAINSISHLALDPSAKEGTTLLAVGTQGVLEMKFDANGAKIERSKLLSHDEISGGVSAKLPIYETSPLIAATPSSTFITIDDKQWHATRSNGKYMRQLQEGEGNKGGAKVAWRNETNGWGLHTQTPLSRRTAFPSFSVLRACSEMNDKIFAAGFTGVYRSDDGGSSWLKLDTLLPLLSGVTVSDANEKGVVGIAACAYAAGCYHGQVDMSGAEPQLVGEIDRLYVPKTKRLDKGGEIPFPQLGSHTARYVVTEYSPNFMNDGIILAASQKAGLQRTEDGGKSWEEVKLPIQTWGPDVKEGSYKLDQDYMPTVHSISFSPSFKTDGKVFISGWNIDIGASTDFGKTFKTAWDAGGVQKFGSNCRVSVSPNMGPKDNTVLAIVRSDEFTKYTDDPLPRAQIKDYAPHCYTGAELFLSKDGGENWKKVQPLMPILDAALLEDGSVLATMGECSVKRRTEQEDWVEWREGKSVPVAQLMILREPSVDAKFELLGDAQLKTGTQAQRVGGQTITRLPQNKLAFAWEAGGLSVGKIDGATLKAREDIGAPGMEFSAETPWFQQTLPGEGAIRGKQSLLVGNAQGHLAGASGFGVVVSKDGKLWKEVFTLPHTVTSKTSANMLPGCKLMRNSVDKFATAAQIQSGQSFADNGIYCLECMENHARTLDGDCKAAKDEKDVKPLGMYRNSVSDLLDFDPMHEFEDDTPHHAGGWVRSAPGHKSTFAPPNAFFSLIQTDGAADDAVRSTGASPLLMLAVGLAIGLVGSVLVALVKKRGKRLQYDPVA